MKCHACHAALSAHARFCHQCGARTVTPAAGPAGAAGWRAGLPWAVAGAAVGALVAVVALRTLSAPTAIGPQPVAAAASDISQLSPEERAARLFDRLMRLAHSGQADSVRFFAPMALQAYALLPALDVDARFHIGLISLATGNAAAALAQADTIRRLVATHLFVPVLRAQALEARGDTRGVQQAYAEFRRLERAERARQRPEYADHEVLLDAFSERASQAAAPSPPSPR